MKQKLMFMFVFGLLVTLMLMSCNDITQPATSDSGVSKASVQVKTDPQGNTGEQKNYIKRVTRDNELGSVKHLYIISAYTRDVLEYSTVVGKVTSSGKRITPKTVQGATGISRNTNTSAGNNWVKIGDKDFITDEVMDENGTYGESANYVYWFDAQDQYHQYFPSGGTYLHISEKPLRVLKSNLSVTMDNTESEKVIVRTPIKVVPTK